MGECCQSASVAFFDSLASTWDSGEDMDALQEKFEQSFRRFGMKPEEHVLDAGCGTGNLTAALLRFLSAEGRVTAVDISKKMIEVARSKIEDARVTWVPDAIEHMAPSPERFDRIICFSVWPHLEDASRAVELFLRMLRPGGRLHIWHLIPRMAVNEIHARASEAVCRHVLAPASATAALLRRRGFIIEETRDDHDGYLVTARKAC